MTSAIDDSGLERVAEKAEVAEAAKVRLDQQVEAAEDLQNAQEEVVNPFAGMEKKREAVRAHTPRVKEMLKKSEGKAITPLMKIAKEFEDTRKNPELKADQLVALRDLIKEGASKEEILKIVLQVYKDPSLAAEVLDFLLKTTEPDSELAKAVTAAKKELVDTYHLQIKAGLYVVEKEAELIAQYRNYKGDPPDVASLFQRLNSEHDSVDAIEATLIKLLSTIGEDLKPLDEKLQKKPMTPEAVAMNNLMLEARTYQAILGIYRFYDLGMSVVDTLLKNVGHMERPAHLTYETIAKQFMTFVADRMPQKTKLEQIARDLGMTHSTLLQIAVFQLMRDSVPKVAPLVFRTAALRDDSAARKQACLLVIFEELDDLETALENELDATAKKVEAEKEIEKK